MTSKKEKVLEFYPSDIDEIQIWCALRFDGYAFEEEQLKQEPDFNFPKNSEPIIETLTLHADPLKNFAAFFALQRFLFKWGGEMLTKQDKEHVAFDFLFLHLYHLEVPKQYRLDEYHSKWNSLKQEEIENAAGFVRLARSSARAE